MMIMNYVHDKIGMSNETQCNFNDMMITEYRLND